jgi:haloalkane dehalogenase
MKKKVITCFLIIATSISNNVIKAQSNEKTKMVSEKVELTIEKSIAEVWEVMGNQFAEVHKWSSNFKESKPGGSSKFEGINYSLRETITDRGITIQVLETFDPKNFSLKYHITEGMPEIAKSAYSTWSLEAISSQKTLVVMDFNLEPKIPLNEEMKSKIESGLKSSAMQIAEELKYYLEKGIPHPTKANQLTKKNNIKQSNKNTEIMKSTKEISAKFPFESKYIEVKGSKMHYIDEGEGDPILFLHGNPTSSYLWRNIVPYMSDKGRCIAVDLIGMGKSDQPDIEYGYTDAADYLEAFIDSLGLKNVTLVLHDWGAILGFDYANKHRDNIKAIAFMEAAIQPVNWEGMPKKIRIGIKMMKSPIFGPLLVKRGNLFIKKMLPDLIMRDLTDEEMAVYAAPYPTRKSRQVLLRWPQDVPMNGKPAQVHEAMMSYSKWLKESDLPKLCLYITPGVGFQSVDRAVVENEFKNTKMINLGEGNHFLQEDYPHEIGSELAKWYTEINK